MKIQINKLLNRYYGALTLLVLLGAILRLFNLGYSDYQGDEIKAFLIPDQGQSVWNFLLTQRKGPMQFIITFLAKLILGGYDNQLLVRLPFALAGIVSIYYFYKLIKEHFGNRISLYATLFFITNGFLIAFSRIVQYQSFVIMFMIGSLYYFTLASRKSEFQKKGIILGFVFWALSILSHYDGVFTAPFVLFLLFEWWKNSSLNKKEKISTIVVALVISGLMLASFYIPFVLSLSKETLSYWGGRLSGDVSGKISSSTYLFQVYQPIYVLHFYRILTVLGLFLAVLSFFEKKKIAKNIISKLRIMTVFNKGALIAVLLWFALPFIFMEKFVYIPGTHIYTYLIPLFVIISFGIYLVESLIKRVLGQRIGRSIFVYGISLMFVFIYLQVFAVFVDSSIEYPWREEKFFFWTFPKPNAVYHLSMFGFPYYRNWEGIRDFIKSDSIEDKTPPAYSTNERKSLVRYYVPLEKSSNKAGYYIYIKDPQSFTNKITEEKSLYWTEKYNPDFTLSRNGEEIVKIYKMVPGSLKDVQQMGY